MVAALLSRAIRALCLSGIVLGMTAALAHEATTLMHIDGGYWTESVVANSDPEGELNNGSDPPLRIGIGQETDAGDNTDSTMESYNFPETEIGNGTSPPNVNP